MKQYDFRDQSSGFSILENLIALVILAFGMMSIVGMLLISHKTSSSSYLKQQAVQASYDIIDRIRTNNQTAIAGGYNTNNLTTGGAPVLPTAPSPNCATTTCSASQLASYDLWVWLTQNLTQLPNGSGSITTSPTGSNTQLIVTVQWDDSPAQLGAANSSQASRPNLAQFVVQTLL